MTHSLAPQSPPAAILLPAAPAAPPAPPPPKKTSAAIITVPEKRFSEDLMWEDRVRLRAIILKTHRFLFAVDPSNRHLDEVIDKLGPIVRHKILMKHLSAGSVG